MIYKITFVPVWTAACRKGLFEGSPDDRRDGYIHFSTAEQVQVTAEKYYRGREDLLLVAFEEKELPALKWEPSRGGELFPHLYAPLPTARAVWAKPLALGDDGIPGIPEGLA